MKRSLSVTIAAAWLAGCGTAGTSVPAVQAVAQAPQQSRAATATISITIPAGRQGSAAMRRPAYISSATNSMTLVPQNQAPIVVALTPASPGCSVSGGTRTCQVTASLPVGTYPVTVSLFASGDGSGARLATTSATETIVENTTNTLSFTLSAVVKTLILSITPDSTFTGGTPSTRSVNVDVLDPAGATIVVGTDALVDASGSPVTITLSDADTSGATSVTPSTVGSGPSTLSYNGATTNAGSITATARNASAAVITSIGATFAVTSVGGGGAPSATVSRYVGSMNYTTLYQEGQTMGGQGQSGLVILDFGQPWHCDLAGPLCGPSQVGTYGTFLVPGSQPYETTTDIAAAAEAFIDGWFAAHKNDQTQSLHLAVGTNNYCKPANNDCARIQFYEHGHAWGVMMNAIATYVKSNQYDRQVYLAGASDLELGFNSAALTQQWVSGYNDAVLPATDLPLYDYGDAEGCPGTSPATPGNRSCSVSEGFAWTQDDVLSIAFGTNTFPVPEIYCSPGNSKTWYQLSLRSIAIGNGKILFPGTLTEHSAAAQRSYQCSPGVPVNTVLDGFQQLKSLLHGNPATDVPSMIFATDITYSVGDPTPLAKRRSEAHALPVDTSATGVPPAGPLTQRWLTQIRPATVAQKEAQFQRLISPSRTRSHP